MTYLKVAGLAGVALASPVLFHQTWLFVAPGLYHKERRVVLPLVLASTALFLGGVAFGYFVMFRYAFPFFLQITTEDVTAVLSIGAYLDVATKLLFAFGLAFQLPVVVFALARMGLVDHRDMIHGFRYGVVGIFVVAAVLTPPDVLSQVLMAVPLLVLYGVGVLVAWGFSTKKRDAEP
jgi:sec-independent protein translocase protein TatC